MTTQNQNQNHNTILVRWNSKTFIFKPPHNELRITKYGIDKLNSISNQLTSGESYQSNEFPHSTLEFDKPWLPDPSDPLDKLRMIMKDQIESINCKTIGLTSSIQLDIDSLSNIDVLKYQIIKLKYDELKNELRLTHRFPNWYYPMIEFIKSIPEKLFIKIRLMDYFTRLPSRGIVMSKIRFNENGDLNVISNSKLNNGVVGRTNSTKSIQDFIYHCDDSNPLWTIGRSGRGSGGYLFKQIHDFIQGGRSELRILKPEIETDQIRMTTLLEDNLNHYLINCQSNSHFYDDHHSTLTWLNNLTVTILDSSQESNRIRQILKSNQV